MAAATASLEKARDDIRVAVAQAYVQILYNQELLAVARQQAEHDAELLEQNGELLSELGFEIEPFGETDYVIRAVPFDMDPADAGAAVEEIFEKLRRGSAPGSQSVRDEILHTVACKAAIKAGWDTDPRELQVLVDKVASGEIRYCPHGRPVAVELTRKELDRQFSRIV